MFFGLQAQKRRKVKPLDKGRDVSRYPHALQMYHEPPQENISLQEFEDFAIERLKVLKAVETVGIRHVRGSNEYQDAMQKELQKLDCMKGILRKQSVDGGLTEEEYDFRRKDHISHFILRLAYCRSEELRRWFLQQELDLFRFRFSMYNNREDDPNIQAFLQLNKLQYSPIPEKERDDIAEHLANASYNLTTTKVRSMHFYKVPFIEALDLVRSRKCYLSHGSAYVPYNDLVVIILSVFRSHLSHALAVTSRALPHLEEDSRLLPMLCGLSKRYLGQDYTNKKSTTGTITAEMVDGLAKKSFPLCMQQLHQSLRQTHHMKHWGRQQYGLFLKGIGLSMEEALRFWKSEFTKLIDGDKFDRMYSYNIRHNYGKEGKRADYTPYSCMKIIMSNPPGPGDAHGCPFKHSDVDLLKQKLQTLRISKENQDEIVGMVKGGHYQLACGKYFEASQKVDPGYNFTPNHPNQYFEESQRLESGDKLAEGTPKNTPRAAKVVKVTSQSASGPRDSENEFDDLPLSMEEMEKMMEGVAAESI